jgi:hypothetical protein
VQLGHTGRGEKEVLGVTPSLLHAPSVRQLATVRELRLFFFVSVNFGGALTGDSVPCVAVLSCNEYGCGWRSWDRKNVES